MSTIEEPPPPEPGRSSAPEPPPASRDPSFAPPGGQYGTERPEYFCSYHPDRRAQGVCMACRKVVCNECSTKIDGINHCITCLQRRATTPDARELPWLQEAMAGIAVVGLLICGYGLVQLLSSWWA